MKTRSRTYIKVHVPRASPFRDTYFIAANEAEARRYAAHAETEANVCGAIEIRHVTETLIARV